MMDRPAQQQISFATVQASSVPFGQRARRGHARKCGQFAMDIDQATELIRHTLVLALTVSAPMLIIGLAVGIIVSLLQAVTQIQEQTLTFVPKIAAMFAAAILLLPWIGHHLVEYTASMLTSGQLP
jgi:flagellar biosynthetic protein FliQ